MAYPQGIQQGNVFQGAQQSAIGKAFEGPQAGLWQREAPTTGLTITVLPTTDTLRVKPAGTIAALTVNLPTPFADGHYISMLYTQIVTALTYANGTVSPTQTATTAGQTYGLKWDATDAVWRVVT